MSGLQLAFIAVILESLDGVIIKHTMDEEGCPWAVLIFLHVAAVLLLLPLLSISVLTKVSTTGAVFLLLSGILWVVGDLYCVKAYKHLDAAVCSIYGKLRIIFITIAGIVIFSESISLITFIGIGLILAAITYQLDLKSLTLDRGIILILVSVIFHTGAFIVDKHLTSLVAEGTIVFYGFLLPALVYTTYGHRHIKNILPTVKASKYSLLISPVFCVTAYYCLIAALARGDLSITYIIQETSIIFIFVFEVLLLKSYDNFFRKAASCCICTLGAILVCGFA